MLAYILVICKIILNIIPQGAKKCSNEELTVALFLRERRRKILIVENMHIYDNKTINAYFQTDNHKVKPTHEGLSVQ